MFKRNLLLLATCQGLMLPCTSLTMATSALVGVVLAPTHALGWEALNRYTIPVVCFATCIIALLGWQLRQRQPQMA